VRRLPRANVLGEGGVANVSRLFAFRRALSRPANHAQRSWRPDFEPPPWAEALSCSPGRRLQKGSVRVTCHVVCASSLARASRRTGRLTRCSQMPCKVKKARIPIHPRTRTRSGLSQSLEQVSGAPRVPWFRFSPGGSKQNFKRASNTSATTSSVAVEPQSGGSMNRAARSSGAGRRDELLSKSKGR
jgi:hypothetical protein